MLLLEQDITRKGQVETTIELDKPTSKECEVEAIYDSMVYASKSEGHLPGFYYLVS